MPQQVELCPPYPAASPDYKIIEILGEVARRGNSLGDSVIEDWTLVDSSRQYDDAAFAAREHCVSSGREVWVYDQNDGDTVVLRVNPAEYTARALANRSTK